MAKYIVENSYKPSYDKNYKIPLINIIPAIVWSIPFHQKLFPEAAGWLTLALCAAFVVVYVALSYIPWAALIPGVASVIILSAMFWVFADNIGNQIGRIIVKAIIAIIFALIEIAVFANATIPWLEGREANKPRIRVEK